MARFVRESIPDKTQIIAGETFTKSWTFRNTGETAWPEDVVFCQSSGDDMKASIDMVRCKVQPNSEWTFSVTFTAPEAPGKYTSFFRLQTGNIKFGHKAWCDIMVVEKEQELQDKDDEDKPASLAQSQISLKDDIKTPKQIYMEKVEKLLTNDIKTAMVSLYDFGFVCFDTNLALMNKYKDVNKVVDVLLSGGLNQSAFDAVYGGVEE